MKKLLLLLSFTSVALAAERPNTLSSTPSVLQSIRQIVPPAVQSTLLEDTERETDLRASLEGDKSIKALASIESVNCVEARCQILVEKIGEQSTAVQAFSAHLENHPEFGKTLLVSPNTDKENKKLLTFVYSPAEQMTRVH